MSARKMSYFQQTHILTIIIKKIYSQAVKVFMKMKIQKQKLSIQQIFVHIFSTMKQLFLPSNGNFRPTLKWSMCDLSRIWPRGIKFQKLLAGQVGLININHKFKKMIFFSRLLRLHFTLSPNQSHVSSSAWFGLYG